MNAKIEQAKMKLCAVADKVENSKAYKSFERGAVAVGAAVTSLGIMGMSAFAAEVDNTVSNSIAVSVSADEILDSAQPFITAGIPILCIVGDLKLGIRFLRGSMH